jgi:hypothetical protein
MFDSLLQFGTITKFARCVALSVAHVSYEPTLSYQLITVQVPHSGSKHTVPEYTIDMLTDDIDSGRVQLVLNAPNLTVERTIHASSEVSVMRLSQTLKRHPPRYESNQFVDYNKTDFMTAVFNKYILEMNYVFSRKLV